MCVCVCVCVCVGGVGGGYTIVQGHEETISAALEVYTCRTIESRADPQM